ncbi:Hypothetical predicted protein [Mytilus galloprovincialis]|uniref:DUF6589 domain-containing protein n=1 Tax=Mytilus galloprovincialis TaxID=29158 RepID=A0A8B6DV69_MYTGA|nr:Hypothetical predicted protein [Mytilus galloprovincialis]
MQGICNLSYTTSIFKRIQKKCSVIPFGILEKDENKTGEMIEIIEHLQQYTPKAHDKMMPLLMGGDGLSVAKGEGAQKARADGISQENRLEGFIWKSEDWHAHVISLQVQERAAIPSGCKIQGVDMPPLRAVCLEMN